MVIFLSEMGVIEFLFINERELLSKVDSSTESNPQTSESFAVITLLYK